MSQSAHARQVLEQARPGHQPDPNRQWLTDKRITKTQLTRLAKYVTTSDKIRQLKAWGFSAPEITRLLNIRYQMVHNVLGRTLDNVEPKTFQPLTTSDKRTTNSGNHKH